MVQLAVKYLKLPDISTNLTFPESLDNNLTNLTSKSAIQHDLSTLHPNKYGNYFVCKYIRIVFYHSREVIVTRFQMLPIKLALIGQAVSEEKIFEIVDGRTMQDHGHPISSPCEPNGSGELKS